MISFYKKDDLNTDLFLSLESRSPNLQEIVFIDDNSIMVVSPPYIVDSQVLGVGIGEKRSMLSYRVGGGDTLHSIAQDFQITEDTIRWANSITGSKLNVGDELLILPTTGVLYYIQRGDTLGEIAQRHKAKREDIISFNNIEDEKKITPGDLLIIPGGEKATTVSSRPTTQYTGFVSVTHGTVTQTTHSRHLNAVDIANACGTPIYSTLGGTVIRTGTCPTAGRYVLIDHGNMQALYGHLQVIYVSAGQRVGAGQQIGTMGNTGYVIGPTGCHIHFETRGGLNPFRHMQRGQVMR